jgi:Outer membrane protein beta-barrel domain
MRRSVWMMIFMAGLITALTGASAWGQVTLQTPPRFEFSAFYGWTFSGGVSSDILREAPNGNFYNSVDPKDSESWGFSGGYFINPNMEIEFLYDRQESTLEISGPAITTEIGKLGIDNYDGNFSYNFGSPNNPVRPFVMFGIGATHYGGVDFNFRGQTLTINGNTKASASLGGGFKLYPLKNVGIRLQARWTPTYISTQSDGWWCDPFWGCYLVSDFQYSNQFETSGGLTFRF